MSTPSLKIEIENKPVATLNLCELLGLLIIENPQTRERAAEIINRGGRYTAHVIPGVGMPVEKTIAQKNVERLLGALDALNGSARQTVNFNGESFTRASISTYRESLVYWQAQVLRENEELAALRGECGSRAYAPLFVKPHGFIVRA